MASLQTKYTWITIATSMSDTGKMRKLGADKIALLGLFVGALLTARLVVGLRSALVLSGPIALRGTGLSISMPMGNGWQSDGKWSSLNGAAALGSSFSFGGKPSAWVICRYLATAETETPLMRFEREASEANGEIVEGINEKQTDMLIFEWARVKGRQRHTTILLGTTILPDGGQLDVEVNEMTGDTRQAEQVFNGVIESVNFQKQPARGRPVEMRL